MGRDFEVLITGADFLFMPKKACFFPEFPSLVQPSMISGNCVISAIGHNRF
jgi:hypothetical protein